MKNAAELFKKILESSDRPAVKLTIERDGEAPIVIEDAQEYVLLCRKNGVFTRYIGCSFLFMLVALAVMKEEIGKAQGLKMP